MWDKLQYTFKPLEEIVWAAFIAVVVFILADLAARQDFTNWRDWLPVLAAGCARAAAGAALAILTRLRGG